MAVPFLEKLLSDARFEVVAAGVSPDKPVGRKQILTPSPVKQRVFESNVPVCEIQKKDDIVDALDTYSCDIGLVVAFGHIFPEEALSKPKYGTVNVHFSLLPQYRGASPVQSALLNGDLVSGITWQKMAKGLDTGDILFQSESSIEGQSCSELFQFFATEGALKTGDVLESFIDGSITPLPQDDTKATFCSKFEKSDGLVNPRVDTAETIWNKYRAFDVWPGIFVETAKGNVKLTKVSLQGSFESFALECAGNTTLFVEEIQVPGKKPMPIQTVLRGAPDLFYETDQDS